MKFAIVFIMILSLFMLSVSCTFIQSNSVQSFIHVLVPEMDTAYWNQINVGLEAAGLALGMELVIHKIPEDEGSIAWIKQLGKSVRKKPTAIILVPPEDDGLLVELEKAQNANIKIVYIEEDYASFPADTFIFSDNKKAAEKAAEELAMALHEVGKIVLLSTTYEDIRAQDREWGFKKGLSAYPEMTLINTYYCESERTNVQNTLADVFSAYPDIQGIFAVCPETAICIAEYLRMSDQSEIAVVGFDQNQDTPLFIKNNSLYSAVVRNPYRVGYMAVEAVVALMQEQSIPKRQDVGFMVLNKEILLSGAPVDLTSVIHP